MVLEEIVSDQNISPLKLSIDFIKSKFQREQTDIISKAIKREREIYRQHLKKGTEKQYEKDTRKQVMQGSKYLPNYNPYFTLIVYNILRFFNKKKLFNKIKYTGYTDEVLKIAKKRRLIIFPAHTDMTDSLIYAILFLENKFIRLTKKPPVIHMGDKLNVGLSGIVLQLFNSMFIKEKKYSNIDVIRFAKETEIILEDKDNIIDYFESTRSRDGKIAPLKKKMRYFRGEKKPFEGVKRGIIGTLLWVNNQIDEDIYITTATFSSPISPDINKDYTKEQKTGKKAGVKDTIERLLFKLKIYSKVPDETGIYVHFTQPIKFTKKYFPNNSPTRLILASLLRKRLKDNITVLPENLLAYSFRYMLTVEPDYIELNPEQRLDMMRCLYAGHTEHILSNEKINKAELLEQNLERSFQVALNFYQKLGMITDDYIIKDSLLIEWNSNRIQHFLNKYPLVPDEQLGRIKKFKYLLEST